MGYQKKRHAYIKGWERGNKFSKAKIDFKMQMKYRNQHLDQVGIRSLEHSENHWCGRKILINVKMQKQLSKKENGCRNRNRVIWNKKIWFSEWKDEAFQNRWKATIKRKMNDTSLATSKRPDSANLNRSKCFLKI